MNPTQLQPVELMEIAANFFESEGIHYRVVGSTASMAYGEPRFTKSLTDATNIELAAIPDDVLAKCKIVNLNTKVVRV